MGRPLEGIRVIDFTQAYSGPFCTMNLADLGAEVIKIERPGTGDQSRYWGPIVDGKSGYYAYVNRNKKGMVIDLASEEGKQLAFELIKTADVLVENFRPDVMPRLGFDYEAVSAVNPRIIYASISGYGPNNPLSNRPAYDFIVQAMGGMMSVNGFPDKPPCRIGPAIGDNFTGAFLAMGILACLYERARTGKGKQLDVAMLDTIFAIMENMVVDYTIGGFIPQRHGNREETVAPSDAFKTKDGTVAIACASDVIFERLAKLIGKPELPQDPRFANGPARVENYDAVYEVVQNWIVAMTTVEAVGALNAAGVPAAPVNDIKEIVEDEQIARRKMLWYMDHPDFAEEIAIPGCPIKIHGEPDELQKRAPLFGEDDEAVLKELLGKTDAEIAELRAKKVIL